MKKELCLSVCVFLALAATVSANTIDSSTMYFEGDLTDHGDGTFSGVIPMVVDAGYNIYAKEWASAWFGDDLGSGPVWTEQVIGADHDAWPTWTPDTPDWYQYSLELYVEDGVQKWAVRNHPGATAIHPWYETGYEKLARGVPMSGSMDWTTMYAEETDTGAYLLGTGIAEIPNGAAGEGGGPHAWDMDWSWGSEAVPLEYPGFRVLVVSGNSYTVTMIPAPMTKADMLSCNGVEGKGISKAPGLQKEPPNENFAKGTMNKK